MIKIEWDNSLSIGIDEIDDQHKMLIARLKDLSDAFEHRHGETEILRTFEFLDDYADFHFSAEEEQMSKASYPGLQYQIGQHAEFKESLKRLIEDFEEEGITRSLTASVNTFLINWLVNHIQRVDKKFAEFLREDD
jgi:hemerythrin